MVTLQRELNAFEAALPAMLGTHDGEFVIVCGDSVRAVKPTYEAALNWAYEEFGLERFLVKQVTAEEPVAHFSRDIGACGT